MGFAVVLKKAVALYGPTRQLQELVEILSDQELQDVLTKVGKKHMQAGFRAVNDASVSSVPKEQLRDARVCFRTAYEFFCEKRGGIFGLFGEPDHENKYKAAILVALCNNFFGDKENTNRYLRFAKQAFDRYYECKHYDITDSGRSPRAQAFHALASGRNAKRLKALNAERDALRSLNQTLKL